MGLRINIDNVYLVSNKRKEKTLTTKNTKNTKYVPVMMILNNI
jgi:hypothetical protein